MATRSIEAIEYRGKVYVSQDDLQDYLVALARRAYNPDQRSVLTHVLDQLTDSCDRARGFTVVSSPRATAGG